MHVGHDRTHVRGVGGHYQPGEAERIGLDLDGDAPVGVEQPAHVRLDIGEGPALGRAERH